MKVNLPKVVLEVSNVDNYTEVFCFYRKNSKRNGKLIKPSTFAMSGKVNCGEFKQGAGVFHFGVLLQPTRAGLRYIILSIIIEPYYPK